MGLLDGILSSVLGNLGGGGGMRPGNFGNQRSSPFGGAGGSMIASVLIPLAFQLLQRNGGIGGVLAKMRGSGLGQHANSWVSTGDNMPVSPDDLQQAFGPDELAQLASQYGLSTDEAANGLAQVLPEVVNQMTPAGEVPVDDRDMISEALASLARRT
jgi:uncharacterized protein YidB (DUF937 family)